MVARERVTMAVVVVLAAVGGWFATVVAGEGLSADTGGTLLTAVIAITVLTSILAGIAAATSSHAGRVDERDHRIAARSQMVRGFFYLALCFGVLGLLLGEGQWAFVNGIFLAILAIETISGLIMLALYRLNA